MARSFPLVGLLILCSCGRTPAAPPPPAAADQAPAAPVALPLEPIDSTGTGSAGAVALARLGSRTLAFIADADEEAIVTFDVEARQPLASTVLGAHASAVLVTPGGRVVALGADDARVHVLVMTQLDEPLRVERSIAVPAEPASAALTPKGDAILVASRWGHALSIVPLTGTDGPRVIDLPRDPAAVVASLDGRRAFVLHAVGSQASVVDLETRSVRRVSLDRQIPQPRSLPWLKSQGWLKKVSLPDDDMLFGGVDEAQGFDKPATKVIARAAPIDMVTLHADQAFAAVRANDAILAPLVDVDTGPEAPSGGYGASVAAATAGVVSLDAAGLAPPVGQRVFGHCLLPRGAAFDPVRARLFVACVGSDQLSVLKVSAHGVRVERDVRVPGGPAAVSVDPSLRIAVVWSAFSREVSVLAIEESPTLVGQFALKASPTPPHDAVVRGRALFNTNFDSRISSDGRGCASCHPDGRDDALAWSSPGGRRQTPMLVERLAGTAPYGWDGDAPDFAHHLAHTTARLRGAGLSDGDARDLQAYLATLHVPVEGNDDPLVARGKAVFDAADTGCAGCHAGEALTDGDTHDVRSRARGDVDHAFDTPSLHLLSRSAPYFHDGRYASLAQLLSGSDGAMGHTAQLSLEDRRALEAYLRQL